LDIASELGYSKFSFSRGGAALSHNSVLFTDKTLNSQNEFI